MKKIIAILAFSIMAFACSSKKEGNMIVKGQIKGLKKGTLYLQKMNDKELVSVDSINLLGNDKFTLTDDVTSPVMYFITFDENTKNKQIMFFGEKGEITINDKLEEFGFNPEIKGSKNQDIMIKFREIDSKFKNQRLDFIKKDFDARSQKDTILIKKLENDYKKMMRRRFLFSTNFAISNANSEAAPYIALTELFDANIMLLDTINNSLSDKIKKSNYGKRLQQFVSEIKKKEVK